MCVYNCDLAQGPLIHKQLPVSFDVLRPSAIVNCYIWLQATLATVALRLRTRLFATELLITMVKNVSEEAAACATATGGGGKGGRRWMFGSCPALHIPGPFNRQDA